MLALSLLTPIASERQQARRLAEQPRQFRDEQLARRLPDVPIPRQGRLSAPPAALRARHSSTLSRQPEPPSYGLGPRKSAPILSMRDYPSDSESSDSDTHPRQRFRPPLSGPDGRLDIPTVQERCAVLSTVAKGVLHFYMDLVNGWRSDSFDELMRNWVPFEAYKTNQLLDQGQYIHHFIDAGEVMQKLSPVGDYRELEGLEDALKMANCATFVHYVHQFHLDPARYNRPDGKSVTSKDVFSAGLRNVSELSDARRVFLSWIVPHNWQITDEVLSMLLDMSIQIFIFRLQSIIESVRSGQRDENSARVAIDEDMADILSGDIVKSSLARIRRQRNETRADIQRAAQRYETFCNVQQAALYEYSLLDDFDKIRRDFPFLQMARDLSSYVGDVVRDVDAGMHSNTLPRVMDRLQRASSHTTSSEMSIPSERFSSVDESPVRRRPVESTPRPTRRELSQPFASQYGDWLNDMMADEHTQKQEMSLPESLQLPPGRDINLSSTQRLRELQRLIRDDTPDHADDYEDTTRHRQRSRARDASSIMASSPPRSKSLSGRLSAARPPSARSLHISLAPQQALPSASEQSEDSALHAGTLPDSPTGAKATRMNFDNELRLVRNSSSVNPAGRLLDGRSDAVRESRFDSQGVGEEDIFLENAKRSKNKAKSNRSKTRGAEDTAAQNPSRTTRSTRIDEIAPQRRSRRGEPSPRSLASPAPQPMQEEYYAPYEDEQPDIQPSPLGKRRHEEVVAPTDVPRASRSKRSKEIVGGTGVGRGLPEGTESRDIRLLSTASGRMMETRDDAEDAVPDPRVPIRSRLSIAVGPAELSRPPATVSDEEGGFVSGDDPDKPVRRVRDAKARADAERRRFEVALLAAAGEPMDGFTSTQVGATASQRRRSVRGSAAATRNYREDADFGSEHDSFAEDARDPTTQGRRTPSPSQVRVGAYRNADVYVTGHNANGRNFWTDAEVQVLLRAMNKHGSSKQPYTSILAEHGPTGTQHLARWNNVQLKDKARNELIRMKREGEEMPYWKAKMFPTLFTTPRFQRYTKADMVNLPAEQGGGGGSSIVAQIQAARRAEAQAAAREEAESQDQLPPSNDEDEDDDGDQQPSQSQSGEADPASLKPSSNPISNSA